MTIYQTAGLSNSLQVMLATLAGTTLSVTSGLPPEQ
jgi:hypothetical protein